MIDFPYEIDYIRELYSRRKLVWKEHATTRMLQRHITRSDIKNCIMSGKIIEQYDNDKPYPSCLILGFCSDERPLHVVCSCDDEYVYIITAYYPSLNKWESDFETRKEDV